LSLDQCKQSDPPNGKITPEMLFPLMPNRHFLGKFWKCKKAVFILPHEVKALLVLFSFNQFYLVKGKIAPVVLLPHEAKQIYMILHWRIRTGSD